MAAQTEPEFILYDLACTKNECFSPAVWKIRMLLNHKQIPYKTVFLEFPDIAPTLSGFGISLAPGQSKYTVPAIHHLPTSTYLMDSTPIAAFIHSLHPLPPINLASDFGTEILAEMRTAAGPAWRISVTPREVGILSPRAEEYFRQTREPVMGPLEALLDGDKEERAWQEADKGLKAVGDKMRREGGPFVLGREVSLTDFSIAGHVQLARVVDEKIYERLVGYEGFRGIYEACGRWMERKD
ncbi:hypothetical protein OQA88_4280 [Cercophora sp. LCS_1]